jgi:hypothetical protein
MKLFLALAALLTPATSVHAGDTVMFCHQEFALCAASAATPTNKQIAVNAADGTVVMYPEAVAVCPVLHGPSVANVSGGNMKGSCAQPGPNQVWSLYQVREKFAQAPTWARNTPAVPRTFVTGGTPTTSISNMFSFACTKTKRARLFGPMLANCYGPISEDVQGAPVAVGTKVITQAPTGATYPVGGPVP